MKPIYIIFIFMISEIYYLFAQDFKLSLPTDNVENACSIYMYESWTGQRPKVSHGSPQISNIIAAYKLKAQF